MLFKLLYTRHRHTEKYIRIIILERQILHPITECMRLTIMLNAQKDRATSEYILSLTNSMRGYIENIKSFLLVLLELHQISDGFYMDTIIRIEEISREIAGWQKYLLVAK